MTSNKLVPNPYTTLKMATKTIVVLTVLCIMTGVFGIKYEPNWESLDSRPLPSWFDEAKFGIYIHWGVFSVPSFGSEWFWFEWESVKNPPYVGYMEKNFRPDFTYADFAPQFTAEFYNPDEWVDIFKAAGARYTVMVTKHHEGFTNWPSNHSFNWNAKDVGPNRDLIGEFARALRVKSDIRLGFYYSLFEWYNPLYLADKARGYQTQDYIAVKVMPTLRELINTYKPDVLWSDGDWEALSQYWNSTEFIAWLYNESPVKDTVCTNDRWGNDTWCKHGGYFTCKDHYNPGVLQKRKWENAMTIDKTPSASFRRNAKLSDFYTVHELITELVTTVSCGGNIIMNIGITKEGKISPLYEERLRGIGAWLKVNDEAIYGSKPWTHQNDTLSSEIWYTSQRMPSGVVVYAIMLKWPAKNIVTLGAPVTSSTTVVSMLGYHGNFDWKPVPTGGMQITIPPISFDELPSTEAWVLKIEGLSSTEF